MDFSELIKVRESCRNYTGEAVPREQLEAILEAARLSPSACNSQPWSFIVADSPEAARHAAECSQKDGANQFTNKAPAFILVLEEHAKLAASIADTLDSQYFAQIDIGLVTAHICLAASSLGLGTCIMGLFDEDKAREYFDIPADKRLRLIVSVGYSADKAPRAKKRRALDELARFV